MKKGIVLGLLYLGAALGTVQAQLKIDFNQANGAVEAGYQGYFATDKNVASFTAQGYQAFGTTVTIKPTWGADAVAAALRMIDRGVTDVIEAPSLMRDWIGTDTRSAGDPMTLTISGLPAGLYEWLSYHHDRNDQTGVFQVTVNDATGSRTIKGIDISNGTNFKLADVTKFTTRLTSNGTDAVTLVFDQTSASSPTANAIFVMNGFELTSIEAETALAPVPAHQATDVRRDGTVLAWMASKKAVGHDVYLGTDSDDIDDGTTASAVYQGRQDANNFDPGRLELGQRYFWRVDEVASDGTVSKGSVWNFTVETVGIQLAASHIVKVTASGFSTVNEGPEKTIDGSGLNQDLHSIAKTDMWLSAAAESGAAWIQYDFDRPYKLHEMLVWNHNTDAESVVGFGARGVTIAYSTNGADWAMLDTPRELAQAPGTADYAANTTVDFAGVAAQYVKIDIAGNWGGLVKQCGLSEVRFLVIPVAAREPQPASGATGVDPRVAWSWRAGRHAAKHNVYISTNADEVIQGTVAAHVVSEPSFDASSLVGLGQTCYWRVDEVNDSETPAVWPGEVWSLSTVAQLPVDDMESYNDVADKGTRIYEVWVDGWDDPDNDSQVGHTDPPFAEQAKVHGGVQSMPFYYDNTVASLSEATRTFDEPQDWTAFGVKALTLWFYGEPNNTAAQMYVKVNGRKVFYDGDSGNLLRKPWHLWYVSLSQFTGIDLRKVTTLALGFEGGQGRVFFDDIQLSALDPQVVTPVQPDAANLLAYYAFEGNTNSSTGTLSGTPVGAPTYVAGPVKQALKLDGARDHVTVSGSQINLPVFTAALWFKVEGGTGERDLLSIYDDAGGHGVLLEVRANGALRFLHREPIGTQGGTDLYNTDKFDDGAWYHLAIVKSAETMTIYINGEQTVSAANATQFARPLTKMTLGVLKHDSLSRFLPGALDEVYLYSRVLSPAEIAWLAGLTKPVVR